MPPADPPVDLIRETLANMEALTAALPADDHLKVALRSFGIALQARLLNLGVLLDDDGR